jgi:cytochrome c-type biogenesis protein CcmH/NrfG
MRRPFPESANAWDSLAGAYMIGGKELAIAYYRKSLELNPDNRDAVESLKKLEAK